MQILVFVAVACISLILFHGSNFHSPDAFDVISTTDKSNYYMKYSGDKGRLTTNTFQLEKSFGKYSFYAS